MWQAAMRGSRVAFEYDRLRQRLEYDPANQAIIDEMLFVIDQYGLKKKPYPADYTGQTDHYHDLAQKLRRDAIYLESEGRL
jgi:hypothetical protein